MKTVYKTKGTCSSSIKIEVEEGIIKSVRFSEGCDGNLKAIEKLVKGMQASEVIERFDGIKCGRKKSSCPDQLAKALREINNHDS